MIAVVAAATTPHATQFVGFLGGRRDAAFIYVFSDIALRIKALRHIRVLNTLHQDCLRSLQRRRRGARNVETKLGHFKSDQLPGLRCCTKRLDDLCQGTK